MRKSLFLTVLTLLSGLLFLSTAAALEPGDTLWTRTYGGSGNEEAYCVEQTTDGGYILAGTAGICPATDFYLLKIDAKGDSVWAQTYGGSEPDFGEFAQQTGDGGYIMIGLTYSFGAGQYDVYLVKTDEQGDTVWTQTYGGTNSDYGEFVQQTTDGGYIITGYTYSFGAGDTDVWLVKTDANGDTLWTRTYGGTAMDRGFCVRQTQDGGYIVAGETHSFGGVADAYLLKTDANGDTLWTRTYGGASYDEANSVQETTDGGYIVSGYAEFGAGLWDYWLIKTDANGDSLWTRTYGGSSVDCSYCVQQTTDGGYIINGFTIGAGGQDFYLVKTDANGDSLWTRTYGGSQDDWGYWVQQTDDGAYIVVGITGLYPIFDVWLLKVAGEPLPDVTIEIVPDDPPVTVPQGERFGYTGTLTNNTEETQVADAWTMATGPEKEVYGPFKEFSDVELEPYETCTAHFYQRVPNLAPLGFYDYIAYCGDYPSTVMDSSFFQIEVIAGPSTKAGEAGWVLTGSFLEGDLLDLPSEFALLSNYPNPFNARTVIDYQLPVGSSVRLEVYNILGEKVVTLVDEEQEAGYKSVTWDASEVSSGVYFYKLTAGDYTATRRMMLVK